MDCLQEALQASREHCGLQQKAGNDNFFSAVQAATAQQLRQQALKNLGLLSMVGLGVGAGARGATGLAQLVNRNVKTPPSSLPHAVPVDLPLESTEEEKLAGMTDFLKGDYAQSMAGVPWVLPASVAAGAAGIGGGWSAMDYLLDKRRKGELDAELETARKEYEAALASGSHKVAEEAGLCSRRAGRGRWRLRPVRRAYRPSQRRAGLQLGQEASA
jgi:hypothetical protein